MNIVSFGGGTNSAALLIGLYKHKIPIDLITFADTGAEHPHTYQFIEIINQWLAEHGMPQITVVQYVDRYGKVQPLADGHKAQSASPLFRPRALTDKWKRYRPAPARLAAAAATR